MGSIIRFRFSVGSEVRFLSHLDLLRTLERALRRTGLPIAHTEGFNPRPKMSFGFALPVGVMSWAEYGDFEFNEKVSPHAFETLYNEHLPQGFRVLAAETLPEGTPALMSVINAARYQISIPGGSAAEVKERVDWLKQVDTFVIERQTKKGVRKVNLRPLLLEVGPISPVGGGVEITTLSSLGKQGNLRIDELGQLLDFPYRDAVITRTAQLIMDGEEFREPMEIGVRDE
ncbi:MAG: TIGR03936 family radical SAM-associated protein [Limnochordia bacterium]